MKNFIEIKNVSFSYQEEIILKNLNLSMKHGEIHAIVGSSGAGKSTLIRVLAGFEKAKKGEMKVEDQVYFSKNSFLETPQRNIGIVFQDHTVFPHLKVWENISFSYEKMSKERKKLEAQKLLGLVRLDGFADRYPHELSGGQVQRVALAMALSKKPKLLLLDEPFSNIDQQLKLDLMFELRQILKSLNLSSILITHDLREAFDFADKLSLLSNGQILQSGEADELFHMPKHLKVLKAMQTPNLQYCFVENTSYLNTSFGKEVLPADCYLGQNLIYSYLPHEIEICRVGNENYELVDHNFYGTYWLHKFRDKTGCAYSVAIKEKLPKGNYSLNKKEDASAMIFKESGERIK